VRTSLCVGLGLLLPACFSEAPQVDPPGTTADETSATSTSDGASSTTGTADVSSGESGESSDGGDGFCATQRGALRCDDFESGALSDEWQAVIGSTDAIDVTTPGNASMYAATFALGGAMGSVARLRDDHGIAHVMHTFAINIPAECVPPSRGLVLASFATFAAEVETTSIDLVLLPDDSLGLRRRSKLDTEPDSTIAAPPRGTWATLELEVDETATGFAARVGFDDAFASQDFVGLGVGAGRRSSVGLLAPGGMTNCAAMYDDVLIVAVPR
jgi:hypothetical protein